MVAGETACDGFVGRPAQGLPEHLTAAQYDSESSGGCKTPPRRVVQQQQQQQLQLLQWDAPGCGSAPARMAESAVGSPAPMKRSWSNSSAEDTTALLGAATGSSEWTAETLLQQCRCEPLAAHASKPALHAACCAS